MHGLSSAGRVIGPRCVRCGYEYLPMAGYSSGDPAGPCGYTEACNRRRVEYPQGYPERPDAQPIPNWLDYDSRRWRPDEVERGFADEDARRRGGRRRSAAPRPRPANGDMPAYEFRRVKAGPGECIDEIVVDGVAVGRLVGVQFGWQLRDLFGRRYGWVETRDDGARLLLGADGKGYRALRARLAEQGPMPPRGWTGEG